MLSNMGQRSNGVTSKIKRRRGGPDRGWAADIKMRTGTTDEVGKG